MALEPGRRRIKAPRASGLLLGAGGGERMGGTPKAFLSVGESLLERAVALLSGCVEEVIVGLRAEDVDRGRRLVGHTAQVMAGGATRQQTIERLVAAAKGRYVLVHDVARPFATRTLFVEVLEAAQEFGAAAAAVAIPSRDSLCLVEDGFVGAPVDRARLSAIQTPQAFRTELLREVLARARTEGRQKTSLVHLFRDFDLKVRLVPGDPENVKITYSEDWIQVLPRLRPTVAG